MGGSNFNIEVGIAYGIADLIVSTTGSEYCERTRVGNVSRKGKASSNINHVLFCDTNIKQALRIFGAGLSKLFCGGRAS